ncbi:MAG: CDP-alcohol phosphatidyltransferase family protein, partial [Clostridia bacterium]|nr:CDP-alcohol phosphatidyltransferase family protein [Clostridia bacterium]
MSFIENIKNNLTVPNALSFMRIIIVVPFVMSVVADDYITAVSILVISGITDFLDGMIARKFNQVTELGKMIDPTADKITLMAVMICVGLKFPAVYPFMIILILKEILMLAAGGILVLLGEKPPAARWYGKV